jgi:hypothetical protein
MNAKDPRTVFFEIKIFYDPLHSRVMLQPKQIWGICRHFLLRGPLDKEVEKASIDQGSGMVGGGWYDLAYVVLWCCCCVSNTVPPILLNANPPAQTHRRPSKEQSCGPGRPQGSNHQNASAQRQRRRPETQTNPNGQRQSIHQTWCNINHPASDRNNPTTKAKSKATTDPKLHRTALSLLSPFVISICLSLIQRKR